MRRRMLRLWNRRASVPVELDGLDLSLHVDDPEALPVGAAAVTEADAIPDGAAVPDAGATVAEPAPDGTAVPDSNGGALPNAAPMLPLPGAAKLATGGPGKT